MTNADKIFAILEKQQKSIKVLAQGLTQLQERVKRLEDNDLTKGFL